MLIGFHVILGPRIETGISVAAVVYDVVCGIRSFFRKLLSVEKSRDFFN